MYAAAPVSNYQTFLCHTPVFGDIMKMNRRSHRIGSVLADYKGVGNIARSAV